MVMVILNTLHCFPTSRPYRYIDLNDAVCRGSITCQRQTVESVSPCLETRQQVRTVVQHFIDVNDVSACSGSQQGP